MAEPTFTVTIAVKNGADTIVQALDSLAAQTYGPFETIVVDDGSADESAEIARGHELQPIVLESGGTGVAASRNLAAAHARGRYLTWLDADDLFHPARLERLAGFITANNEQRPVHTGVRVFGLNSDRSLIGHHRDQGLRGWVDDWFDGPDVLAAISATTPGHDLEAPAGQVIRDHADLFTWVPPSIPTVVARSLFMTAGCFPTHAQSSSDYLFLFNLSRLTDIVSLDEPTYYCRVNPNSMTRTTRVPWPLLTSTIAYRFGGLHMTSDAARAVGSNRPPRNFVLEDQIANAGSNELRKALPTLRHLLCVLYPDRRERWKVWRRLVSDEAASRSPKVARVRDRRRTQKRANSQTS